MAFASSTRTSEELLGATMGLLPSWEAASHPSLCFPTADLCIDFCTSLHYCLHTDGEVHASVFNCSPAGPPEQQST